MNGVLSATRTNVCTCRLSTVGANNTALLTVDVDETALTIVSTCIVTSAPSSLMRGRRFSTMPTGKYSTDDVIPAAVAVELTTGTCCPI